MPMPQIDPSVYDEILSSGQASAQIDPQVLQQVEMAKRLRANSQMPQGAYQSGRRAVAPNPLEYLNHLAGEGVASSRDQKAMQLQMQQQAIHAQQVQQVLKALQAQREAQRAAQASQSVPQVPGGMPQDPGGYYGDTNTPYSR